MKKLNYRPEIDGLRALAVLPVILFHAGFAHVSGGYIGVDVFFVISGFLITGILLRELEAEQFSILAFYERRMRRILPALFLVLTVTMIFGLFVMLPYELAALGRGIVAVIFFLSNVLFWSESGYFAASSELNPLLHTWSLAIEEQYYILFPLALWVCWKWSNKGVVLLLGLAALSSLFLSEIISVSMPSVNFFLLPTRAWELLTGSLTAFYLFRRRAPKGLLAEALGIFGIAAIMFAIFTYDSGTPFPSLWALAPVIGTVSIILAASPKTLVGKILGSSPFVGVGLISYSAYLWHQPLFAYARLLDADRHPEQSVMLILSVVVLVLAWLSWRFVERPFRRRDTVSRKSIFALSGLGSVVLLAIAVVAIASDGLPQRYPEAKRAWISTGPLEYGDFVRSAYRTVNGAPLSKDKPNMVLVGDSFSQDFFNVILAAEAFENYAISAIYVPRKCQVHFGIPSDVVMENINREDWRQCARMALDENDVDKMRAADVVLIAARWQPWAAAELNNSLFAMNLSGDLIIIGSKSFQKNRRALLKFDPTRLDAARIAPDDWSRESSVLIEKTLQQGQYVNILARICDDSCPLFTNDGDLISYDGHHLTPEGAAFLAKNLFDKGPLASFAGCAADLFKQVNKPCKASAVRHKGSIQVYEEKN
jgi:peptidoglycan/LPS O-acetylase OafA/YrhL